MISGAAFERGARLDTHREDIEGQDVNHGQEKTAGIAVSISSIPSRSALLNSHQRKDDAIPHENIDDRTIFSPTHPHRSIQATRGLFRFPQVAHPFIHRQAEDRCIETQHQVP